jgi:hypothetical protein
MAAAPAGTAVRLPCRSTCRPTSPTWTCPARSPRRSRTTAAARGAHARAGQDILMADPDRAGRCSTSCTDSASGRRRPEHRLQLTGLPRHLPADELKLDRSLTSDADTDPRAAAIVGHTIALATNWGCPWWRKLWRTWDRGGARPAVLRRHAGVRDRPADAGGGLPRVAGHATAVPAGPDADLNPFWRPLAAGTGPRRLDSVGTTSGRRKQRSAGQPRRDRTALTQGRGRAGPSSAFTIAHRRSP